MTDLASTDVTHRDVFVNGIRLHVVEAGPSDGETVVLLHGFPEMWYGWKHQIPALARAGYRVIVPDQRGYNRSDKPTSVADYDLDILAADVVALIDHTLAGAAFDRVHLVGHDWGAVVAWHVAAATPNRLSTLSILNVPHPAVFIDTLRSDLDQLRRSWYIVFFQIPWLPETLLRRNDFAGLRKMLRASGHRDTFTDADEERYVDSWRQPGALTAMINWYRAAARRAFTRRPETAPIETPAMVIWGEQDVALSASMAQPSADRCRDGHLERIPDATHWVQHDAPTRVNALLMQHFAGQASGEVFE
ncbi:MAG: alpha/beta fold hydrolase [Bacteroidetes bacterium]|jgi:pimeloyl-ACP methyl ester carboxylesterase|nr:alpha/beta fold hydrolase [Bacteroidota bacterium]